MRQSQQLKDRFYSMYCFWHTPEFQYLIAFLSIDKLIGLKIFSDTVVISELSFEIDLIHVGMLNNLPEKLAVFI